MMTYFPVEVRYPGETLDIRELVEPDSYTVKIAVAKVYNPAQSLDQNVWNCWDFVCREIEYPPAGDYHRREAFPSRGFFVRSLVSQSVQDFWSFPFETLSLRIGDCEDTSILLCSMLRNFMSENEVYVTIGYYGRPDPTLGHGWVTINRAGQKYVLETTLGPALGSIVQVTEIPPYFAYHKFNDTFHQEVKPGFVLGLRDRRAKYKLMRQQYG